MDHYRMEDKIVVCPAMISGVDVEREKGGGQRQNPSHLVSRIV